MILVSFQEIINSIPKTVCVNQIFHTKENWEESVREKVKGACGFHGPGEDV